MSSSWRLKQADIDELLQAFKPHNLSLQGVTPDHFNICHLASYQKQNQVPDSQFGPCRASEILEWLEQNNHQKTKWIAIDDMQLNPNLINPENFVHTNDQEGLTPAKANEAITKLLS